MRLFEAAGEIKKLGNELNADMINYIGSAFPVPTLTAESIANAEGDDGYCLFYFDGSELPEDVKEALYQAAKAEIENNTQCGELPTELTDKARYTLDVIFAPNGAPTDIRIGCELLLADNWKECRNADSYKQYIGRCLEHYGAETNLTKMCAGYSAIDAVLWDADEYKKVLDYVMAADAE